MKRSALISMHWWLLFLAALSSGCTGLDHLGRVSAQKTPATVARSKTLASLNKLPQCAKQRCKPMSGQKPPRIT